MLLGHELAQVSALPRTPAVEAVTTIDAESTIGRATREMLRNQVHHLPIVDVHDHLIGIVSTMDILAELADAAPD